MFEGKSPNLDKMGNYSHAPHAKERAANDGGHSVGNHTKTAPLAPPERHR